MSKINSIKNSKLFNIMTNPITIIITLVVISSIILLYTIYRTYHIDILLLFIHLFTMCVGICADGQREEPTE